MSPAETITNLTKQDIQIIKSKIKRKKKIAYKVMLILLLIGAGISAYAMISQYHNGEINKIGECLIPIGIAMALIFFAGLYIINLYQEINIELKNNKKRIYKGIVTNRKEINSHHTTGGKSDHISNYYICLGETQFEYNDLYFEIKEGDNIEVHLSDKLNYLLYKNIVKGGTGEIISNAKVIFNPDNPASGSKINTVAGQTEFMTAEEVELLRKLKRNRLKKILPVFIIITLAMGVTAEIILRADSFYSMDEKIGMRIGFWLPPICFFLLILFRKLVPLSRDIRREEKIIITDQVINKEEIYKAQYKTYTYNIKGRIETYEVSKEFYDSLNSGDDIEVHKTAIRKKILSIIAPSSKKMFKNTAIFK